MSGTESPVPSTPAVINASTGDAGSSKEEKDNVDNSLSLKKRNVSDKGKERIILVCI